MSKVYASERKCSCFASVQFTFAHRTPKWTIPWGQIRKTRTLSLTKIDFGHRPWSRVDLNEDKVVPYGLVYLRPQLRVVPSKSPLQMPNKTWHFFSFHNSLFKKALLSHFLGQQRGYPEWFHFCNNSRQFLVTTMTIVMRAMTMTMTMTYDHLLWPTITVTITTAIYNNDNNNIW